MVIVVAGMHRSGTSAVTRVLNLLGAALPAGLMAPAADNSAGFWESADIAAMNDAALAAAESSWDDVLGPPADWFASAAARDFERRIARQLAGDLAGHRLAVVKDPRICRLLPSWRRAIERLPALPAFVIPIRDPLEVAHSLARRNQFSAEKSRLLWLRHLIDAERHTRGAARVFVAYADLLQDWANAAERIEATLRIEFPVGIDSAAPEIDRFLAEELRHHRSDAARAPEDGFLVDWIARARVAAQAACRGDEVPLIQALNDVTGQLARADLAFGPIVRDLERERGAAALELGRESDERRRQIAEVAANRLAIARLESAVAIRDDALETSREKAARRERWAARFAGALGRRDEAIGDLNRSLDDRNARISALGNDLMQARAVGDDLRGQVVERERERDALGTALAQARAVGDDLRRQVAERDHEIARSHAKISAQEGSLADAKAEQARVAVALSAAAMGVKHRDAEISRLSAEISVRDARLAEEIAPLKDAAALAQQLRAERDAAQRRAQDLAETGARLEIHRQAARNLAGATATMERRLWQRIQRRLDQPLIWSIRHIVAWLAAPLMLAEAALRWRWNSGIAAPFAALRWAVALRRSPLFDRKFYIATNPAVRLLALDPVLHYLAYGSAAGRAPHPLFDPAYYRQVNADVATTRTEPLAHFLRHGVKERRRTHPLFDCDYYLAANPGAAAAGEHPLLHYLRQGWKERLRPHPLFDPGHYLDHNPDIAAADVDPLVHYVRWGGREGREPHPAFDAAFYLARNVDVAESDLNPLVHYLRWGEGEGRRPNPHFDALRFGRPADAQPATTFNALAAYVQHPREPDVSAPGGEEADAARPFSAYDPLRLEPDAATRRATVDRLFALHRLPTRPDAPPPPEPDGAAISAWRERLGAGFDATDRPEASVIVPVHNQLAYTLACIAALAEWPCRARFEVIVVDDCSSDATSRALAEPLPGLRYMRNERNLGFLRSCNRAADAARGEFLVFLNNDTIVLPGWLDALTDTIRREAGCGLVGSKLLYPDGRLQEAGGIVWSDATGWNYGRNDDPNHPAYNYMRPVDYASGASVMVRRDLFAALGGFDERYAPAYYEDTDLAFRIRERGLRALYQPRSMVVHFEGVSSGTDPARGVKAHQAANRETFLARWRSALAAHSPPARDPDRAKDRLYCGRLLFVDATTPTPDQDAGSVAAEAMMQILLHLGWKVTFVPEDNFAFIADYTHRLQASGVETVFHPHWTQFSTFAESTAGGFDVVLIHRYEIARRVLVDLRRCHGDARTLFMNADLHYLREERRAAIERSADLAAAARRTRTQELEIVRAAELTIVHSEAEREVLARDAPGAAVAVFQWPVELPDAMRPLADRRDIVFVGGYRHLPNVDAATWLAREIMPLVRRSVPEARLRLVGSHVPPEVAALAGEGVEAVGFVPDLADELGAARVAVAPLRYGAGLKGKVIDAMRFGAPGVITPIAAEGMAVEDGREAFIRADAESFAAAIVTLLNDDATWTRMSVASRDYVVRRHSFAAAVDIVERLLGAQASERARRYG